MYVTVLSIKDIDYKEKKVRDVTVGSLHVTFRSMFCAIQILLLTYLLTY